jgi:hypothetical protein
MVGEFSVWCWYPSPFLLRKILKTNNLICDYVLDL